MNKFFFRLVLAYLFISTLIFAQPENDFFSINNRLLFADHLFCEGDFLRAADEYNQILSLRASDSLEYKIGIAFQQIGRYNDARQKFESLFSNSQYEDEAKFEYYRSLYLAEEYDIVESNYDAELYLKSAYQTQIKKLVQLPKLFSYNTIDDSSEFFEPFSQTESIQLLKFYTRKQNLEPKSPVLAAIISTVIPGLGKIYTENYGDGITALLLTGVLTFLSVDNFNAKHDFRGWLFAGLAAYFYAGNIYGSAASANVYNTNLQISFNSDLEFFLKKNNHFVPKSKWLCE